MNRVARLIPSFGFFVFLSAAAFFSPATAHADTITGAAPLDTAQGGIYLAVPGTPPLICQPNCFSPTGTSLTSSDRSSTVSATSQYTADPSISNTLAFSATLGPQGNVESSVAIVYEFEVSGPANQVVPVTIEGAGSSAVSNLLGSSTQTAFGAYSTLLVSQNATLLFTDASCAGLIYADYDANGQPICSTSVLNRSSSTTVDQTLNVTTDTVYDLEIQAVDLLRSSNSAPVALSGLSATASFDPTIALDTTDPAYSLAVSPAPVPEPSALLLAATGLAAALTLRRRHVKLLGLEQAKL